MTSKDKEKIIKKNIKIYTNNDEWIRDLGNILATPKSRKIYQILIDNELNAKEIGKLLGNEENPRLPNLIYHLDKMAKIGLLTVKKRQQRKHGHVLRYYKAISVIIIVPPDGFEKIKNSKTLLNAFTKVFKFSIVIFGIFISSSFFRYMPSRSQIIFRLIHKLT